MDKPINPRYLSQNDRNEIADGLCRGGAVKAIAARIGKSYQTVYQEIKRNRKPAGPDRQWASPVDHEVETRVERVLDRLQ